jgi:4-oxalocrotonate tautomerase
MPMITLQLSGEPDDVLTHRLAEVVTRLTAEALGKDPKVTAIAVEWLPRRRWFIAGRTTEALGRPGFFLEVRVTEGTNMKDEKARYVREAFAAIDGLLGGADPESYVHVNEVKGDAYGYGGRTQERRYHEARPAHGVAP